MGNPQKYNAIVTGTDQTGVPLAKTLAGDGWIEPGVVNNENIITLCNPQDLSAFCKEIIRTLE